MSRSFGPPPQRPSGRPLHKTADLVDKTLRNPRRYALWLAGLVGVLVVLGIGYRVLFEGGASTDIPYIQGCEGPMRIRPPHVVGSKDEPPATHVYHGLTASSEGAGGEGPMESLLPDSEEPLAPAPDAPVEMTEGPSLQDLTTATLVRQDENGHQMTGETQPVAPAIPSAPLGPQVPKPGPKPLLKTTPPPRSAPTAPSAPRESPSVEQLLSGL